MMFETLKGVGTDDRIGLGRTVVEPLEAFAAGGAESSGPYFA